MMSCDAKNGVSYVKAENKKYNVWMHFESLLSDIGNSQLQQHKLHNCSKYNVIKKQYISITQINSF